MSAGLRGSITRTCTALSTAESMCYLHRGVCSIWKRVVRCCARAGTLTRNRFRKRFCLNSEHRQCVNLHLGHGRMMLAVKLSQKGTARTWNHNLQLTTNRERVTPLACSGRPIRGCPPDSLALGPVSQFIIIKDFIWMTGVV